MKVDEIIDTIFKKMREKCYRDMYIEPSWFDPISQATLKMIVQTCFEHENCRYPSIYIAKCIGATKRQVLHRLPTLARYGLINVISQGFKTKNVNNPYLIVVNPILIGIIKTEGRRSLSPFIDHYHKIGTTRLEYETDVQGFFSDCSFGQEEDDLGHTDTPWQDRIVEFTSQNDKKAAEKRRDDFRWADLSKEFVTACGAIWTKSQGELGYGYNQAVWDGDPATLGAVPKRERNELIKLFQAWGGFRTSIAWYVFCCGIPQKDGNGRLQFDLTAPHRQFVTTDKKPSQFAKHFNAILSDEIFLTMTTKNKDEITAILSKYYNNLIDIEPRYETNKNVFV